MRKVLILSVVLILICAVCSFALAATYTWPIYVGATITNTSHTYNGRTYKATDFGVSIGTEVYAIASGTVITTQSMTTSYGNHIIIDHGNGVYSLYAHLSEFRVSQNETVVQGQTIALSGNTGNSTGPHLHFEIRVGSNSMWNAQNIRDYCEEINVDTHVEDPAYASLKGTKVTASKEILVHEGDHAYYDRSIRRIDAGDECTIEAIYTDGCCRVTYPSSSAPGGYRTMYAQKSDFNLPNPTPDVPGNDRVLPDGDYIIATACSTNKSELYYLDIYGSETSATSGTNIHLHGPVSGTGDLAAYDAWTISYSGGFYTIKQKNANIALDVTNASTASGANIQACVVNGSDAQKWVITQNGTNGYRLRAKCSGLSLDAAGAVAASGTNVQQYANNDTAAQGWLFIPYKPSQPIAEGRYVLLSAVDNSLELDVPGDTGNVADQTKLQIWKDTCPSKYNSFDVKKLSNGYYKLIHHASGKVMEIYGGGASVETSASLFADNGSIAQQWAIVSNGSGGYMLKARCSGLCLDLADAARANGSRVRQCWWNGSAAETWKFVPAENKLDVNTLIDGKQENSPTTQVFTCDLIIDGKTEKTGVADICELLPYKASYEIANIRAKDPYQYDGIESGAIKGTIPANSFQVVLKFSTRKYAVTYNANTGSDTVTNMPQNQTKTHGTNMTLSDKWPVRSGYTFLYWNTKSDESGTTYYPGANYTVNQALPLYAIWGKDGTEMTSGAGRSLPDGDYLICSSEGRNGGYLLDIAGSETTAANGTNVQLHTSSGPAFDAWTLKYLDNGFYSILQKDTNMALTVAGGSVKWRANVQVNTYTGGKNQQWSIEEAYTGTVRKGMKLRSRLSGLAVDITGGSMVDGTDIHQWKSNASTAQSWVFIPYEPEQKLENGRYILLSNLGEEWELDVAGDTGNIPNGHNIQVWNDNKTAYFEQGLSQYNAFDVESVDGGYYKLIHVASGKALSVSDTSTIYSTNICVSDYTGSNTQRWAIVPEGDTWVLLARSSGYAMDVSGAVAEDGRNVIQYRYGGKSNRHQQWNFVPAEYTVRYSTNGGSNAPLGQIKYYKGNLTLSDAIPIRKDYVFTGWNTKANGSGTAYAPGDVYRVDEAVTLYAQWRKMSVLKLPRSIKTIEEQAFAGVAAEIIEIPEGCTSIESEAFLNCKTLVKLYIPASVNQITFDAFVGCDNLVIYAPEGSTAIKLAKRLSIAYEITE